ncbi:zinc finger protein 726-like isoform X1 [Lineus longissimus]|uniref:zinc finger protein 726-like isoform X1 n=1 Tax=Lineus longissimus TaxID=88925 RepID=UPI00315C86DB
MDDNNKNVGNDPIEMEHDVGLRMECSEETDDRTFVQVKREPIENEEEGSADEVGLDSGYHIKAKPPQDDNFTVIRHHGLVKPTTYDEGCEERCVRVKNERYESIESRDDQIKFEASGPDNMVTFQYETFSTSSPDQIMTYPDGNIPFVADRQTESHDFKSKRVCFKTEESVEDAENVKYEEYSGSTGGTEASSNVYDFPQAAAEKDSTHLQHDWQGLAGPEDAGDEESAGSPSYCQPNFSAARPGQLPIHVVDPLHGDEMKMEEEEEEEASLSVTGVIPNLHTQRPATQLGLTRPGTEALDLRQAVGQSTGEPFPVNFITSDIHDTHSKSGTTTPLATALPDCEANSFVGLQSSNFPSHNSGIMTFSMMAKEGVKCKCGVCDMSFTSVAALKCHERLHVSGGNVFSCEYCGMIFMRKSHLTQHERIHTGERPFKCSHCAMSFAQKGNLRQHELIHTGEKPHVCEHCGKKFTQKSAHARHERIHTGEKPFRCEVCEMKFAQKGNLRQHEQIHTGEKRFKCEHCGKGFIQKSFLEAHESVHRGLKPFKCEHCEKSFTSKSNVTQHKRIHTGEKRFKCGHCEMRFTRRSILTQHERIHTGEKPFRCDHCEMSFPQKSGLNQHELVHTGEKPFRCKHCDMRFSRKEHCAKHERIHTGEKFQCVHCEMAFTQKGNLNQHIHRIHSGVRPFKCKYCHKGFASQADLKRHGFVHLDVKPLKS